MDARLLDRLIELTDEALGSLSDGTQPLSTTIQKALRIARLRNDWEHLWWLEGEMAPLDRKKELRRRLNAEIEPRLGTEEFRKMVARVLETYLEERMCILYEDDGNFRRGDEAVVALSVPELEEKLQALERLRADATIPPGLGPADLYALNEQVADRRARLGLAMTQTRSMLDRVAHRVLDFLSFAEKQLLFAHVNAGIFERNRR